MIHQEHPPEDRNERRLRMSLKRKALGLSFIFFAAILQIGPALVQGQNAPFELFAVSDLVRVFEDGYNCPEPQKAIALFGMRNEYLSAQCVIKADEDIQRLTISVSPLRNTEQSGSLPPETVQWNFVGSIFIEENTPKLRKGDLIRPAPARFPDYLAEDKETSVAKGKHRAIYLTVKIPKNTKAGAYEGAVTAQTEKGNKSLPIHLTVYPLTLPDERHLMVTEWYSTGNFKKFHDVDSSDSERFYDMLKVYAENMAEHRQNVFRVSLDLIAGKKGSDGKVTFDFSRFDKWADVFWSTNRMDLLETGFVAQFGEGGWSSREILLRDFRIYDESANRTMTMPGKEFLPIFLPVLENHLREKGWLEKTVFHIADEPSNHNVMSWREASEFVHNHAPSLKRIDAIETTHFFDTLEIWVPKLDHLATWYDAYRKAQAQGYELWFYTVGIFQGGSLPNKTVDVPLIESRILHWLNYRYGLKGYLHWGFNAWTDDPFEAPGEHRGDGWHVYPKKDGLINSLRWEQMRNGIQDYEYLWMLEDKIRNVKDKLSERLSGMIEPGRRGIEISSRVVKEFHEYDKDPNVLYGARKQIIEELLDLDKSPLVIVQTNPLEHSTIANDCTVDVFGWAEPETKIIVNGSELPVAPDGLFMYNVRLSKDNTIVVEAAGKNTNKTMVRSFEVLFR
jgi:hypothetical protein